ncbi:MAG: DUF4097 family beta strand repeat protein [Anaerolineae bacterium]|nr:DUF4097 family beta strand repeat protein [Anaerolineae bacterium]
MGQEINELFNTPEGCDLVVENVEGKIEITGWDKPQTQVIAVKHNERPEVEISQDGRKVIARTRFEQEPLGFLNWFTNGRSNGAVDYTIYVPHNSNVKVKHVNGPIKAVQINGNLDLHGVDGPTQVSQVSGDIHIHTVNGSVMAEALQGSAKLNAVNGKLKVKNSTLQSLTSETVNGEIEAQAALNPEGRYHLKTVNGGCRLTVQEGFRARVSAKGINLSVKTSLPTQAVEKHFGHWHGIIGSGDGPTAEITFDTVNGSLRINDGEEVTIPFAPPAPPTPPMPPAPPAPPAPPQAPEWSESKPVMVKVEGSAKTDGPKTKTEVLEMIERGEITVSEGLKLLENL